MSLSSETYNFSFSVVLIRFVTLVFCEFIEYLKIEKNYSVNTLSAYKKDLIEFQVFINENFDKCVIKNVDYKIIRSWIVLLVNKNLSNRSINRKVSSLKS